MLIDHITKLVFEQSPCIIQGGNQPDSVPVHVGQVMEESLGVKVL